MPAVPSSHKLATRTSRSSPATELSTRKACTSAEQIAEPALHGTILELGLRIRRQRLGELLHELLLLRAQLARNDDAHRDVQIAAALVAEMRHAAAANAERR